MNKACFVLAPIMLIDCSSEVHECRCIGSKFAVEEAVLALLEMHRRFTYILDHHHHPTIMLEKKDGITLQPKGLWLHLTPRA